MAKKEAKEERKYFNPENWEVTNVRILDFGTFFTLRADGIVLPNLRAVPAGKDYDEFIAMPQTKGNDGNYYNNYRVYFDDDTAADILEEVSEKAAESKKRKKNKKND